MSDPGSTYRTRDEITSVRQLRDPVERIRKLAMELGGWSAAELKDQEKIARKVVDDAVEKAKVNFPPTVFQKIQRSKANTYSCQVRPLAACLPVVCIPTSLAFLAPSHQSVKLLKRFSD